MNNEGVLIYQTPWHSYVIEACNLSLSSSF